MKKIKTIILLSVMSYLLGSFASASFNISEWNEAMRIGVVFIYTLVMITIIFSSKEEVDKIV